MLKILAQVIVRYNQHTAPAFIIGLLRILYGIVALQEILFLLYFNHLIFDPVPYIEVEFPMMTLFLALWAIVAGCVIVGYRSQNTIIANYIFWVVFVNFTPMQRDFDGGFDLFMIGVGFFLIFMPIGRSLSIDNLRYKLQFKYQNLLTLPNTCSALSLLFPVFICLGLLYFDSALHKLFAPHWLNGLGGWLPLSLPYYISALDLSWMLNLEILQKLIGYLILLFQLTFIFLFYRRRCRPIFFLLGVSIHIGITVGLNIYPFGLGMLSVYSLLVPFSWWALLADKFVYQTPQLTVFYDGDCALCNRTAIIINHFDLLQGIAFKDLQTQAGTVPQLQQYDQQVLLTDLYAIDLQGQVYVAVDTYIQIFRKMRYLLVIAWLMRIPGIYHLAKLIYRRVADNRLRHACDKTCLSETVEKAYPIDLYTRIFENYAQKKPQQFSIRMAKIFMILVILQLNSSLHYAFFYRFYDLSSVENTMANQARLLSNSILMLSTNFLGITPHSLYLHDHFAGYEDLLAISYIDLQGREQWLPFINEQGRMLAPNWGRVHSMWANIAVTPNINRDRLSKFIMKVTAFWGHKVGLNLNHARFIIKHKKINSPEQWKPNLRQENLSTDWKNIGTVVWKHKHYQLELQAIE